MALHKVKITGLWKDKDKNGKTVLKGNAGNFYAQVLPNSFKSKDSEPDYILYFTRMDPVGGDDALDEQEEGDL